jgi:NADPH:quinone reductase-like Zn-dependent oxidoreductase
MSRMRAVQFSEYGEPEVLTVVDVPEPHAGGGEVRIKVQAAGVNAVDWKIRSGLLAGGEPLKEPQILGFDAAGVVDEVGEGVTGVAVGDDVFGLGRQTYAEYTVLKAWTAKPASLDWAVAGGAGVVCETAERGLRLLGIGRGSNVFIDGGAGGVGAVAVQLARVLGANVIASASQNNQDYLREIGATPVLYGEGLVDRVRAARGGDHIDGVFDVAGKTPIEDLISLVAEPSRVVTIANFSAGQAGARLSGAGPDAQPFEALRLAAELLAESKLVIKVQTFPFDRAAEAHRSIQSGHSRGKLVLVP